MDPIAEAKGLYRRGRYAEAINTLGKDDRRADSTSVRLLRAELLAITGDANAAAAVLDRIRFTRLANDTERAWAEWVQAQICKDRGNTELEASSIERTIALSERANDLERTIWAQLRLLHLVADASGHDSSGPLFAAVRTNVTKLGDPILTAALHLVVGQIEGKRGLATKAASHLRLGMRLLRESPHLWLEAWGAVDLMALALLNCDLREALELGETALKLNQECGYLWGVRACMGNLGYVHFCRGEFNEALKCYGAAYGNIEIDHEHVHAALESEALVYLARGELSACEEVISRLQISTERANRPGRYAHRGMLHLKLLFHACCGDWVNSAECASELLRFAHNAGDELTAVKAKLRRSEALLHLGRTSEAWNEVESVATVIGHFSPDVHCLYERNVACVLLSSGNLTWADEHQQRAGRVAKSLSNVAQEIDLNRACESARVLGESQTGHGTGPKRRGASVLQSVSSLMLYKGRVEFLARELVAIAGSTECARGAVAVSCDDAGREEVLASFGDIQPDREVKVFAVGTAHNRSIEFRVQPLADYESLATINSITMLLGTVRDLEQARIEREERLTLWPSDELPLEDGDAIISGRMRDVMATARKVARTNVAVLITGESGTGKEVLARAIHNLSPRAKKPFVPLNCTAVPRDLLESQLFGHRRGAFTGADRDHLGVVRTARDGTLFLDEIGEMSLDLQPKLLRFLESGEISPLGEPNPFNVDVRIIAATNANLARLVEDGRFREDLFYRLHGINLPIPPLRERRDEIPALVHHFVAKAAAEFKKGRMRVDEETMEHLLLFGWPGNVRQLQNELRRMVALADVDSILTPAALTHAIREETTPAPRAANGTHVAVSLTEKLPPALLRIEREMIQAALRANKGRAEATARALGISRKGLYLKRQRLGI